MVNIESVWATYARPEGEGGVAGTPERPREIPFAGLFHDPGMVPGESIDEALKQHWADDIDRDRG